MATTTTGTSMEGSTMQNNPLGARVWHIGITLGILTTVAVVVRLMARWRSKAKFAADDLLIVVSLIPFYAMIALSYFVVTVGHFGMPMRTLNPGDIPTLMKIFMCTILTYSLAITMVKISLLMLFRRIFTTAAFRLKSMIVGVVCVAWFFVAVFTDIFQCSPFKDVFELHMLFTDHCINVQAYYWGISASNVFLDLVLLYLPIHEVWKLQLPRRKKLGISSVFALGSIVCVAGIMRTVTISDLETSDFTVTLAPQYAWSQVEPALAIICACIITYGPLMADISKELSRLFGTSSRGSGDKTSKEGRLTDPSVSNSAESAWVEKRESELCIPGLSAKVAGKGLHVVHIGLGVCGSPATETFYQQPRSKHDVTRSMARYSKPRHKSPPFMTEGRTAVVKPFV